MATHGARAKWEVMKLISRLAEMGAEYSFWEKLGLVATLS